MFFLFFPVRGIYRSLWLCNRGSLFAVWAGIWNFLDREEAKQWLLAIYEVFGSSLFPNVPDGPALHRSRHVSISK